jgi:hypothetical protein
MRNFVVYEPVTGLIELLVSMSGDNDLDPKLYPDWSVMDCGFNVSGASHYVLNGKIVERPELPVTQSGQTLTVPKNTRFSVRGPAFAEGVCADGVLEFAFPEPGTYTVKLELFPYLDKEIQFES